MNKYLLVLSFILSYHSGNCQFVQYCGSGRFDTEVFSSVQTTTGIQYGSNNVAGGGPIALTMDIYEPSGDTMSVRPLIVWAHGGSFIGGTKEDADVVSLSQHFAKRGYVCVSINYRTGFAVFPPDGAEAKMAVFRAVQDMKAAVRYFRKDAVTTNTYHIDPSLIFAGGSSAGAFTALHMAYLDQPSELPAEIDTNLLGGMEGNSGNPGYSSEVNAIINLCGAIGDKTWIHAGDEPVVSMHGTNDQTVPYATDTIIFLGIVPIMQVDGSYSLSAYANSIGLMNDMYTYFGQGHVPYFSSPAYMDTTVRFVSNFLYRFMGCTPSDPNPAANTFTTGITCACDENQLLFFPNPSNGHVHIKNNNVVNDFSVYNGGGQKVFEAKNVTGDVDLTVLTNGVYYYRLTGNNSSSGKLVIVR